MRRAFTEVIGELPTLDFWLASTGTHLRVG
jgi:hypothetical protein